jgi:hypothetical protein
MSGLRLDMLGISRIYPAWGPDMSGKTESHVAESRSGAKTMNLCPNKLTTCNWKPNELGHMWSQKSRDRGHTATQILKARCWSIPGMQIAFIVFSSKVSCKNEGFMKYKQIFVVAVASYVYSSRLILFSLQGKPAKV